MSDRDSNPPAGAAATDAVHAEDLLQRRKAVFGKLYVVSLKDIYEIIGDHSPRIEDAVRLMCRHAIERHVGDADPVTLDIAGAFLFRFNERNDAEGWAKAKAVVDEVGTGALGARYEPDRHHPMIRLAVAAPEQVLDAEDRPEPAKVAGTLDAVREVPREQVLITWKARPIAHEEAADNDRRTPALIARRPDCPQAQNRLAQAPGRTPQASLAVDPPRTASRLGAAWARLLTATPEVRETPPGRLPGGAVSLGLASPRPALFDHHMRQA